MSACRVRDITLGTGRLYLTTSAVLLEDEKRKFVYLFLCAAKLVCSLELHTDLHDRAGMAAHVHTDLRPASFATFWQRIEWNRR